MSFRREPPYSSLEDWLQMRQLDQGVLLLLGPEGPGLRTQALSGHTNARTRKEI